MKRDKLFLIGFALFILIPIFGLWMHKTFFYEYEMNQIESDLNKIEGVSVVDIWGLNDITLENIGAKIKIEGKGEIKLIDLSSDANNYPDKVLISEIGGYSFRVFSCTNYKDKGFQKGLGNTINISDNSEIGKQIGIKFKNPQVVIENYDNILNAVKSLKKVPERNYFKSEEREFYILVYQDENELESLFEKHGVTNLADFQLTFNFKNPECG
ncbi:hypothetical protein [Aureivirga sp. CE67]|uniref:hypothetical protein n=1 Tax=Aureivirga sp. CE67 TaxID=1788983 RepID=UPI0018CADF3F|nr:hypothetical protein [Aureivirga sp. CE67]